MCISRRIESCINWLKKAEHPDGGICMRVEPNGELQPAYAEVTGYLIPSLRQWGEYDFADRLVKWLIKQQREDGAFPDPIHGQSKIFDTAMVIQGLRCYPEHTSIMQDAYRYVKDGLITKEIASSMTLNEQQYLTLAGAVINHDINKKPCIDRGRIHYIAYYLEGLQRLGKYIEGELNVWREQQAPFNFYYKTGYKPADKSLCVTGNFQMAILLNDKKLFEIMCKEQLSCGGFPARDGGKVCIPWAAKYFLDAAYEFKN